MLAPNPGAIEVAVALEATRTDLVREVSTLRPRIEEVVAATSAAAATEAAARAEMGVALDGVRERVAFSVSASPSSGTAASR